MLRARDDKSKDVRRQDILDCAEQIIQEQGLESLSIAAVAKRVRLAVGTIYLYFPKKEDIIAQLTIKSRELLLQKFQEGIRDTESALEQVRNILLVYFHFYRHHTFYHQLVSFYETNAGLAEPEELLEASKHITDLVAGIIRLGKRQQCIRSDINEYEFSFLLWGTAVGIIQLINVKASILDTQIHKQPEIFYDDYIDLIIRSLR